MSENNHPSDLNKSFKMNSDLPLDKKVEKLIATLKPADRVMFDSLLKDQEKQKQDFIKKQQTEQDQLIHTHKNRVFAQKMSSMRLEFTPRNAGPRNRDQALRQAEVTASRFVTDLQKNEGLRHDAKQFEARYTFLKSTNDRYLNSSLKKDTPSGPSGQGTPDIDLNK